VIHLENKTVSCIYASIPSTGNFEGFLHCKSISRTDNKTISASTIHFQLPFPSSSIDESTSTDNISVFCIANPFPALKFYPFPTLIHSQHYNFVDSLCNLCPVRPRHVLWLGFAYCIFGGHSHATDVVGVPVVNPGGHWFLVVSLF
jgi:hypothetical protein